jgi:hypothetical protein
MNNLSKALKLAALVIVTACGCAFARSRYETIDAAAYGTSTQLGRNVGVTVIIYEWSNLPDRQILLEAFQSDMTCR